MRNDYFSDLLPESVTPVTPQKTKGVTHETGDKTFNNKDLPDVLRPLRPLRPLRQENNKSQKKQELATQDETSIRAWLRHINETDPELINEVIDKCRNDPVALKYFLWRAEEVPLQQ